jgi:hypothetical protein
MNFGWTDNEMVNLKEGVNDVTPVVMFKFLEGQYGPQVYFEFGAGNFNIKHWVGTPNDTFSDGTPNTAYDKHVKRFKSTIQQFLSAFYSPAEVDTLKEKVNAAGQASGGDLEKFCEELVKLLPKDWTTRSAQVVLHFSSPTDQYLSVPKWATMNGGRLFTAHPDRTLELTDFFKETFMGVKEENTQPTTTTETPTFTPTNWKVD